jgi:hypothetical protein
LAGEADLNLVCTGNSYKQDGPFPTGETFSLKVEGKKPVMIGGPGSEKPVKARTIVNNAIQLKFTTGKFTGEYFNFTGDLFLIHTDSLASPPDGIVNFAAIANNERLLRLGLKASRPCSGRYGKAVQSR